MKRLIAESGKPGNRSNAFLKIEPQKAVSC